MPEKKHTQPEEELEKTDAAADEGEQPETEPSAHAPADDAAAEDAAPPTREEFDAVVAERDRLRDQLMRTTADYQNFVRRSEQNLGAAREQQVRDLAKSLVTVLDHFDSAMEAPSESSSVESVLQGVQIVRDELLRTLQSFGVQRLDAEPGEEFDPERHEALMHQQVEGSEPNRVAAQLKPGYVLGERTLRPAQVSVTQ